MNNVLLIAYRELHGYFSTFSGYLILAAHLLVSGLLFNAYAVGSRAKFSQQVIEDFFYLASGMAIITAVLLAMRLIAEERQTQSLVLLRTAPVSERQIVLGKFLSALAFFTVTLLASFYLPLLVLVHGKVSLAQIVAGYLGLFLLGAACISIALLASAWCTSQLMAGASGALMVVLLLVAWLAARVSEEPVRGVLSYLALHNTHFMPIARGLLRMRDVVYYLGVTVFFLECTIRSLESWRWRE
jgi:ABC-2 type transport system permease protein